MTQLTKNFTLEELTRSLTAVRLGIDNTPSSAIVESLELLCVRVLQPLRTALGPVTINSGYRSATLNKRVGGAVNSHHVRGMAVDLVPQRATLQETFDWLRANTKFTQLIWEFGEWVHVSYDPADLKCEVLEAYKETTFNMFGSKRVVTRYKPFGK